MEKGAMEKNTYNDSVEKILKNKRLLQKYFSKKRNDPNKTPCLSEEAITDVIHHTLPTEQEDSVFEHLSWCNLCLDLLKFCYEENKEAIKEKKESLIETIEDKLDRIVLIIKSFPDRITTIFQDGGFTPIDLGIASKVRHNQPIGKNNFITFAREISPFLFKLEIEKKENNLFYLRILLTYTNDEPANNIRLNLFKGEDKQESNLTKDGFVSFDKLDHGKYLIKVSENGNKHCEFEISLVQ